MMQSIAHINRFDPAFSAEQLRAYDLVFQVNSYSCLFSVFDGEKKRYIGLFGSDFPMEQIRGEIPWIGKAAKSVLIIIENNRSTLVPDALFDEHRAESYLRLVAGEKEEEVILYDELSSVGMYCIYGVNENLYEQVTGFYPEAEVRHISGVLIDALWMNYKNRLEGKRIFLDVRVDSAQVLIFGNRQLLFSNAFAIGGPEDLAYYLLFVMEHHDLNPEEVPVTLTGLVEKKSPVFELLSRYVRHIDFASGNEFVKFIPGIEEMPGHFYYTLLNPVQ